MVNKKNIQYLLRLILVFLSMNVVWYMAYLLINHSILPSPLDVYFSLSHLEGKEVWIHICYSLFRIVTGVLLALTIGMSIGLIMGRSRIWNKILDPVVYLTYPIPKIALLPVVML